jgi:prepilin-type N-terminal cleavage/methylation domain-containing protein
MDKFSSKERFGFTLIEILIVIAIMGALAVIVVPMIFSAPAKARDTQRIETIEKIANFLLERYSYGDALPLYWQFVTADYSKNNYISPGSNDELIALINDNLPYFGGVFPEEPLSDFYTVTHPSIPYYGFIYGRWPSRIGTPYEDVLFTIATRVEDPENGNHHDWHMYLDTDFNISDSGDYYIIAIGK